MPGGRIAGVAGKILLRPDRRCAYQAASRYLHDLVRLGVLGVPGVLGVLGVLGEMSFGKEKLFIHLKLLQLLGQDSNNFQPYA